MATDDAFDLALSLVIPAYNEELRLPHTLKSVVEFLEKQSRSYEIIIVDDGSTDRTQEVALQFARQSRHLRLLSNPCNSGKGSAVRLGVLSAKGKYILVADADGAAPIDELTRLEGACAQGAAIAIGSRALQSADTRISTVWYRKVFGRIFNGAVNLLLLPGVADTQCGFKLFENSAAQLIFSKQRSTGYAYDVEILFLARKFGLLVAEIPINWKNIPGTKVNLLYDSCAMFFDILIFRLRDLLGEYDDS